MSWKSKMIWISSSEVSTTYLQHHFKFFAEDALIKIRTYLNVSPTTLSNFIIFPIWTSVKEWVRSVGKESVRWKMSIQIVDRNRFLGDRDVVLGVDQRHVLLPPKVIQRLTFTTRIKNNKVRSQYNYSNLTCQENLNKFKPWENVVEEEVARGLAGVRDVTQNLKSIFETANLRTKKLDWE